ncbi:hypothetical protein BJ138DRAFT_1122085 [Hygrophoropsis aurantiaca]|uniref:Uncharacterized protein n=1 Tax=Hygrophoropsis aurantiaca TaxID=72124 RepID=A0ACB8AUT2_9AGAM|nr:hypothetical protein BJ138DRAFT_1122085 [Hygrophoropsis aurantiaca]
MANRYAPIPNPRTDPDHSEMEAAFEDPESDDEQDSETHPMLANTSISTPSAPGTYDFEAPAYDYDCPPPGSPPPPSTSAVPNSHGNSNGIIPVFTLDTTPAPPRSSGWFRRTAANVLPSHYVNRWGILPARPSVVGGGTNNDGVFANVTAKPSRGIRVQDGDDVHIVPEETSRDTPPSYAAAQADAAPPYFSTTILAPFSLSSSTPGSVVVDSLPTGTLFSFCWNALVSVSFQFVGFLLTYLMHTTHAARLGSRAGLGVTLIQYGFGLRARMEDAASGNSEPWNTTPVFSSTEDAKAYTERQGNSTLVGNPSQLDAGLIVADATTEWLSFFLMTIGWFILLTSALGFWRVKRWETSILSSAGTNAGSMDGGVSVEEPSASDSHPLFRYARFLPGRLSRRNDARETRREVEFDADADIALTEQESEERSGRQTLMTREEILADPDRARRLRVAIEAEQRLHNDLRAAGLL